MFVWLLGPEAVSKDKHYLSDSSLPVWVPCSIYKDMGLSQGLNLGWSWPTECSILWNTDFTVLMFFLFCVCRHACVGVFIWVNMWVPSEKPEVCLRCCSSGVPTQYFSFPLTVGLELEASLVDYRCVSPCPAFVWVVETEAGSCLHGEHFTDCHPFLVLCSTYVYEHPFLLKHSDYAYQWGSVWYVLTKAG